MAMISINEQATLHIATPHKKQKTATKPWNKQKCALTKQNKQTKTIETNKNTSLTNLVKSQVVDLFHPFPTALLGTTQGLDIIPPAFQSSFTLPRDLKVAMGFGVFFCGIPIAQVKAFVMDLSLTLFCCLNFSHLQDLLSMSFYDWFRRISHEFS